MQGIQDKTSIYWRVISGRNIPLTLFGRLRRPLRKIFIVTPFLEDYEFYGKGSLSRFLLKHISEGVKITMLTMPPEGKNGTKKSFSRKYKLMNFLAVQGVRVLFNSKLHAKVFLFDESEITKACILGSANLTRAAMEDRLEIAIFTHNRDIYKKVLSIIDEFKEDDDTISFIKWKYEKASLIKEIMGGELSG